MEKKILVIGSAVVDVIIDLEDNLPTRGQDVHVRAQKMQMGGCGFNTYHMIRHFGVPVIPFFPIGTVALCAIASARPVFGRPFPQRLRTTAAVTVLWSRTGSVPSSPITGLNTVFCRNGFL